MTLNLGTRLQDSLVRVPFSTQGQTGSRVNPVGTITQADFNVYKDGTLMTLDAGTVSYSGSFDVTGSNRAYVDLSNDADFTPSAFYELWWASDATIDSQLVTTPLAVWTIESNANKGVRLLSEIYANHELTASVSHSVDRIEVSPIINSATNISGEILLFEDVSAGARHVIRCTNLVTSGSGLVANVEMLDGTSLPAAPDAGDYLFRSSQYTSDPRFINTARLSGSGTTDNPWGPE